MSLASCGAFCTCGGWDTREAGPDGNRRAPHSGGACHTGVRYSARSGQDLPCTGAVWLGDGHRGYLGHKNCRLSGDARDTGGAGSSIAAVRGGDLADSAHVLGGFRGGQTAVRPCPKRLVVERPARQVQVYEIVLESFDEASQEAVLSVSCGKGTYIRTFSPIWGMRWAVVL